MPADHHSGTGAAVRRYKCRIGDAGRVVVVVPVEADVDTLFALGWVGFLHAAGISDADERAFPCPSALASRIPADACDVDTLERACGNDGLRPIVLASVAAVETLTEVLFVPQGLAWFPGHFPGHPVVPGVTLVDWAIGRMRAAGWETARIAAIHQLKFHRTVGPNTVIRLRAERIAPQTIRFAFESRDGVHTRAELRLAST